MTPALTALALMMQAAASPAPDIAGPSPNAPDLAALIVLRQGDEACELFDRPRRALLDASIAQARDDQVRAGLDPARLDRAERRIEAASPDCNDSALLALAHGHDARVRDLATYSDLSFPGIHRVWNVDRGAVRSIRANDARWRVSQRDGAGRAMFGVFEREGEMTLAMAYSGHARPARASLVFRDGRRQAYPIDFSAGGLLAPPDNDPVASWGGGLRAQTRISAAARLDLEAAQRLAPASGAPARGFVFPQSALAQMSGLTPRESVGVEMYDPAGQVAERIWFEVGALKAALAMQAIALIALEPAATADPAPAP